MATRRVRTAELRWNGPPTSMTVGASWLRRRDRSPSRSEEAEEDYVDRGLGVRRMNCGLEAGDLPKKVRIPKDNQQQAIGYRSLA